MITYDEIIFYKNKLLAMNQIKHHAWNVVLDALEEDFETYKNTLTPNEIAEAFISGVVHKALALATIKNKESEVK